MVGTYSTCVKRKWGGGMHIKNRGKKGREGEDEWYILEKEREGRER